MKAILLMGLLVYLIGMLTLIADFKDEKAIRLQKRIDEQNTRIEDLTYRFNQCKLLYIGE